MQYSTWIYTLDPSKYRAYMDMSQTVHLQAMLTGFLACCANLAEDHRSMPTWMLLLYRLLSQGNAGLDGEDSMASVASHRGGVSSRAPALMQTAVRYRAGAAAGALCSTPPSANKKGGWSMSSTGRGSPGPTPKPRVCARMLYCCSTRLSYC